MGSWRSFWTLRRGEGRPVAAATVDGGDELRSGCAREREQRRGEGTRESERVRGGVATSGAFQGDEEGARQAEREVAWRGGARARRARSHPPAEDEDDRGGGQWAGPALAAAGLHREEAQVGIPFYFCFLIF